MLDTTLILSNTNRFKTHQTRLSDSATSKRTRFQTFAQTKLFMYVGCPTDHPNWHV